MEMKSLLLLVISLSISLARGPEEIPFEAFPWSGYLPNSTADGYLCEKDDTKKCSCDKECFTRKDCCVDQFWDVFPSKNISLYIKKLVEKDMEFISRFKRAFPEKILPPNYLTKHKIKLENVETVLLVSSCQFHNDTSHNAMKCNQSNHVSSPLVPVVDEHGLLYRSADCAICNSAQYYTYLNLSLTCKSGRTNGTVAFALLKKGGSKCRIKDENRIWKNKETSLRNFKYPSPLCNNMLCFAYYGLAKPNRNLHCDHDAACRAMNESDTAGSPLVFEYSVLMDLNKPSYKPCTHSELQDILAKTCTRQFCNYGYKRYGSGCVKEIPSKKNFSNNTLKCFASQKLLLYIKTKFSNITFIRSWLRLKGLKNATLEEISNNIFVMNDIQLSEVDPVLQNISTDGMIGEIIDEVGVMSGNMEQLKTKRHGFNPNHVFPNNKFCALTINITSSFNFSKCSHSSSSSSFNFSQYNVFITIDDQGLKYHAFSCEKFYLDSLCKLEYLKQYTVNSDWTIESPELVNKKVRINHYVPYGDGYAVCDQSVQLPYWKKLFNELNFYISLIGTILSILCLLVLLVKFKNDEVMNLPKLDITGMCCSILLSDCLYVISAFLQRYTRTPMHLCVAMAFLLHWFILSEFTFVLIIAYHFFCTIHGKITVERAKDVKKSFIEHCTIAVLMPFLFIICNILVFTFAFSVPVIYGSHTYCWINDYYMKLASYNLPLIFSIIISFIWIAISIYKIYITNKNNTSVMKQKERKRYASGKVALKMILLLGIVEALQYIQIVGDKTNMTKNIYNSVVILVTIVFRSFKGAIISLLYYSKKR